MADNSPAPDGWNVVTPRIVTSDPQGLVRFLQQVFAAEGEVQPGRPAEIRIGDSLIMISGDSERAPMAAFLYVYVEDAEATFREAIAQGATSLEDPRDTPYGDRRAMVRDEWGNIWQIAHRPVG
jgi:PhnB protein